MQLVDTDLCRPFVATNLGLSPDRPGLAEAAIDEGLQLSDVVQSTPYNLAVLPAGAPPAVRRAGRHLAVLSGVALLVYVALCHSP